MPDESILPVRVTTPEPTVDHVPAADTRPGSSTVDPQAPIGTLDQSPEEADRAADASARAIGAPVVPGYEILEVLGRGGMGVVYKARQVKLNRVVALKMILGTRAGRNELIRFLAEAEAVAAVKHVNVVQVFDYGDSDGGPFMALEYLPGGTFAKLLEDTGRDPAAKAALVAGVARGVAAAHALGIVHRDLKPANVMLDENGIPKVTDFGLAKRGIGSDLTAQHARMGTPLYMSPEQADGKTKFVGPQADVWALGVILYESLTGTRPFDHEDRDILYARIRSAELIAPRKLAPAVPRDLELICLKCLEKQPHERYPTAKELADDLDRFARHEPISVRPAGTVERAVKWVMRNKVVAGAAAAVFLALIIGAGVSVAFWLDARLEAKAKGEEAERANKEWDRAEREKTDAINARDAEGRAKRLAQAQTARAEGLLVEGMLAKTRDAIQGDNIRLAKDLLNDTPWHLRGWEYRHLWTRVSAPQTFRTESMPSSLCFTGDSSSLAASYRAGKNSVVRLWAVDTGAMTVLPTAPGEWSLDLEAGGKGELVGVRTDLVVQRWDLTTGQRTATSSGKPLYKNAFPEDSRVCFSPDRKWLAYATDISDFTGSYPTQPVKLWDVEKDVFVRELCKHTKGISKLRYSPKGTHIASTSSDKTVKLWDLEAQAESTLDLGADGYQNLWFTPDGAGLLVKSYTGIKSELKLWDIAQKKVTRTILLDKVDLHELDISPDARWYATGEHDGRVRVWEFATGKLLRTYHGHTSAAFLVRFSPDGKKLASADYSGLIQVWDAERDAAPPNLSTGKQAVRCIAFAPDGKTFATGGEGTFSLWDASTLALVRTVPNLIPGQPGAGVVWDVAYSPDGRHLAVCGRELTLWEAKTGKFVKAFPKPGAVLFHVAFSPDGKRVYTGTAGWNHITNKAEPGEVWGWEVETGKQLAQFTAAEIRPPGDRNQVDALAVAPDGQVLTGGYDRGPGGVIKIWDPIHHSFVRGLTGHSGRVLAIVFNSAGTRMASSCQGDTLILWDTATWKPLHKARIRGGQLDSLRFSKDGTRLFGGCQDGSVRVWDVNHFQEMLSLAGHGPGNVRGLALSPDGTRLVSGGKDGTIRIWESLRTPEYADLKGHRSPVTAIAFAPDGSRVFAWDKTGELLAWSLRDGAPAETDGAPPEGAEGVVTSPDGRFRAEPFGSPANGNVSVRVTFVARGAQRADARPLPEESARRGHHTEQAGDDLTRGRPRAVDATSAAP